jgi:hypothetical protein
VHAAALLFLTGGRHDDNRAARVISDLGGCRAKTQSWEAKLATRTDNQQVSITQGVDAFLRREAVMAVTFTVGGWVSPSSLTTFATAFSAAVRACCGITASCGMTAGLPVQGLAATSLTAGTVSVLSPASAMRSPLR